MRESFAEGEPSLERPQSAIGEAEKPLDARQMKAANNTGRIRVEQNLCATISGDGGCFIERNAMIELFTCFAKPPEEEERRAQGATREGARQRPPCASASATSCSARS